MKNRFIIGLFFLILALSLIIPKIALFLLENHHIDKNYQSNVTILKASYTNDQAALIRTIYSKYNGEKYSISINDVYEFSTLYYEENEKRKENEELVKLQELEKIGIIQAHFFTYMEKNKTMVARINKYQGDNMNYSKIRIFLPTNDFSIAFMSFEVEQKTGKIIALKIPKEYVNFHGEVMKDYVSYLGFSKSDWLYETNSIKSKTNRLEIKIEEINDLVAISIVPYY